MFDDLFEPDAFDFQTDAFSDFWVDQAVGKENEDETRATVSPRAFRMRARRRMQRIKQRERLQDLIKEPPRPGEELHIVGGNKFQFYTWIPVLLDWIEGADEFYCATWTANAASARDFFELWDAGRIRKTAGFMFGTYFKRREPVVYQRYAEELHRRGGWIKCFETHAKVMLLNNEARGDYLTVEGSGNLTHNPRFEQYVVINDRALWDFHRAWALEVKELKKKLPW